MNLTECLCCFALSIGASGLLEVSDAPLVVERARGSEAAIPKQIARRTGSSTNQNLHKR
jgi:hypothetical protein